MFCPKCGKQNPDNSKFCSACGYPLNAQAASAVPNAAGTNGANEVHASVGANAAQSQTGAPVNTAARSKKLSSIRVGGFPLGMIIADAGALLTIISVFTPLYHVSFFGTASYNYFSISHLADLAGDDGSGAASYVIAALMLIALSAVIAILRFFSRRKTAAIVSIVLLLLVLFLCIGFAAATDESYGVITLGPSPALSVIGSATAVFGNFINWKSE